MAEICETVLFHRMHQPKEKFKVQWEKGIWLGKVSATDEHIIGTPAGGLLARSVARRPEEKRWSGSLLAKVVCTPWDPAATLQPKRRP